MPTTNTGTQTEGSLGQRETTKSTNQTQQEDANKKVFLLSTKNHWQFLNGGVQLIK